MKEVRALGILSSLEGQAAYSERRGEMLALSDSLASPDRGLVSNYLRNGGGVLAIMEHTKDIIGAKFDVAGGSGILTDGHYFWRGDAADYVDTYGISPGAEFVEHVRRQGGKPKALTQGEMIEIDDFLSESRRRGEF
ncbi:hypothetical protein [Streptomyces luteolus]|uniref:Uncharacterized protein n=1 Tax=Streptomyces luteolus TaxID=3043615 RepID=A0ABT6SWG2_9ACTN|nr:hypothetical protein [Streptomyces sp. B-S-A12]MDI3419942.1 hypothetical protein [Streptomyces sp. B-S-A12]